MGFFGFFQGFWGFFGFFWVFSGFAGFFQVFLGFGGSFSVLKTIPAFCYVIGYLINRMIKINLKVVLIFLRSCFISDYSIASPTLNEVNVVERNIMWCEWGSNRGTHVE